MVLRWDGVVLIAGFGSWVLGSGVLVLVLMLVLVTLSSESHRGPGVGLSEWGVGKDAAGNAARESG